MDIGDDFLTRKSWEGLQNSREMLEELTLVYSTF